jgi:hypothetical protein
VYNIDLPAWEFDPEFDLRNHIREVTLEQGTEAEFKAVAGRALSTTLDRQRPLWDLTLVHGLPGGKRTGAVLRMHHCMADGIAGVEVLGRLLDFTPNPPPQPKQEPSPVPPPRTPAEGSLLNGLISSYMSGIKRILAAETEVLTVAGQVMAAANKSTEPAQTDAAPASQQTPNRRPAGAMPAAKGEAISLMNELQRLLPELATPDRLPFNVVCHGPQKFNYAEVPFAEIKAVKDACEATVNDVVLTVVASSIRRYAELHGVALNGRSLRIVVPVNVRPQAEAGDFGNRITFLPVDIPLDVADPRQLLEAVQAAVTRARSARLAELVGLVGTLLGAIPTAFQALIGPLFSQLPLSICNLICTNVPGPKDPLYLAGHQLLACYPYVPIGGEMGMNCAILTYNGTAYFGFTGDAQAVPDLYRLDELLKTSFAELKKACGIRTRTRTRSSRPRRSKPKATVAPEQAPPAQEGAATKEPVVANEAAAPGEAPNEPTPEPAAKATAVAGAGD